MSYKIRRLVAAAVLLAVASSSFAARVASNNGSWAALATMSSSSRSDIRDVCASVTERGAGRAIMGDRCAERVGVAQHAAHGAWAWGGGIVPVGGFIAAQILLYLFTDTELHGHPRGVSPG